MLVVATGVTQAASDKQQLVPMLKTLAELPAELGSVRELLAAHCTDYENKRSSRCSASSRR